MTPGFYNILVRALRVALVVVVIQAAQERVLRFALQLVVSEAGIVGNTNGGDTSFYGINANVNRGIVGPVGGVEMVAQMYQLPIGTE